MTPQCWLPMMPDFREYLLHDSTLLVSQHLSTWFTEYDFILRGRECFGFFLARVSFSAGAAHNMHRHLQGCRPVGGSLSAACHSSTAALQPLLQDIKEC